MFLAIFPKYFIIFHLVVSSERGVQEKLLDGTILPQVGTETSTNLHV
jgi:hypothetical protein